jgi:diguanylate cyclase (GGDEF)-like protein/PAS domain S-box-containing protein
VRASKVTDRSSEGFLIVAEPTENRTDPALRALWRALDASGFGMALVDPRTRRVERANARLGLMLAAGPSELEGRALDELAHPDDVDDSRRRFDELVAAGLGGSVSYELRMRAGRGPVVWVSVAAFPVDLPGEPVVLQIEDIDDRRRARHALEESEQRFRVVAASAPIGVFVTGPHGRIVYCNPWMTELLTRMGGRAQVEHWAEFVHPDDRGRVQDEWRTSMRTLGRYESEHRILNADGSLNWIHVRVAPMSSDAGEFMGFAGTLEDITERRLSVQALEIRERRFRQLATASPLGIFLTDRAGRMVYANPKLVAMIGDRPGGSGNWVALVDPVDRERVATELRSPRAFTDRSLDFRIRTRAGELRWLSVRVAPVDDPDGGIEGWVGTVEDVTERVHDGDALRRAEQQFRMAFENSPIGMAIVAADGRYVKTNDAYGQLLGYTAAELATADRVSVTHPAHLEREVALQRQVLAGEVDQYRISQRYHHRDGTEIWAEVSVSGLQEQDGSVCHLLEQVFDVTERRQFEQRLAYQATHDPLTGLPNRALLMQELAATLAGADAANPAAVVFLDLDHFKWVNDSLGHDAGDDLLRVLGHRLQGVVRTTDLVGRFGGDEFVVIMPGIRPSEGTSDRERAAELAARLNTVFRDSFLLGEREVVLTASLGIAFVDRTGLRPEQIVRDADAAMYRAKELGRDRFEVFDAPLRARAVRRMELEHALRRAVEREELRVWFQPEVDLATGTVVGCEALVRWERPEHGLVMPNEFIPLAEETGVIQDIGAWVLREACRQAVEWPDHDGGPTRVRVNLAPRQLASGDLVSFVELVLTETGLAPDALCLEITETALVDETGHAREILERLALLGVRLAVDDFGTGWSSLGYLKRLPVDELKIDRSFVDGLGSDAEDTAIVTAVVNMAEALGLAVVAEGVETVAQRDELVRLGCRLAQGYLFGRPQPELVLP